MRNTIGGVRLQGPSTGNTRFFGELSQRAVTDSLLSYAGARDDRTGRDWGGVVSTGGRLGINWDDGQAGAYGQGSYHKVTGESVADNDRVGVNAGFYVRLLNAPENTLTIGADVTYFKYDKNLRYFSLGQGGYFSPQQYTSLSVPIDWIGRSGRLSYQLRAAIGIQRFRESDSDWFPNDAGLQAALAAAAAGDPSLSVRYSGQTKTGGLYNLLGVAEYQAAPQLYFGGSVAFDNSRDYRQSIAGVYLRYAFSRETSRLNVPPVPLRFNVPQY